MRLKNHVIAGVIGAGLFYPLLGPWRSILFFLSSVLIDADHYLDYLWRTRFVDWSPRSMFKYYDQHYANQHDQRILGFSLLHKAEMFIIIYCFALYINYDFFITVLGGMAFHMIFDVINAAWYGLHFSRPYSLTEYFIRKHHMKKKGLDPDEYTREMYERSKNVTTISSKNFR